MQAVSVIIPAYNQAQYLAQAVQSVLDQSFADLELLVVDDGSTDATAEVLAGFGDPRLRVVHQANAGLSAARNMGIRQTSAPLVTFLDADDLFLRDKLAVLTAYLDSEPQVGLVAGSARIIDECGAVLREAGPPAEGLTLGDVLLGNPLPVSGILLRRAWLQQVGAFDESLRACEDWDLWLRLLAAGCRFAWVDRPVLAYRFHPGQMTREPDRMRTAMLAVLDKFFRMPNLPAAVAGLRNQAYAAALVRAAARGYSAAGYGPAGRDLAEAVRLDPSLQAGGWRRLADLLAGWAQAPQVPDPEAYLRAVHDHLPPALAGLRPALRRAMAAAVLGPLFRSAPPARRAHRRALLRAVWADRSWLRNRGVWRLLADAWLPLKRGAVP